MKWWNKMCNQFGRDENYILNVLISGKSLNPRMAEKSAVISAIAESRIPGGTSKWTRCRWEITFCHSFCLLCAPVELSLTMLKAEFKSYTMDQTRGLWQKHHYLVNSFLSASSLTQSGQVVFCVFVSLWNSQAWKHHNFPLPCSPRTHSWWTGSRQRQTSPSLHTSRKAGTEVIQDLSLIQAAL